jgi:hypothetical protein
MALYHVLNRMLYGVDLLTAYDGTPLKRQATVTRLDKIDKHVVGRLKTSNLHQFALTNKLDVLTRHLATLQDKEEEPKWCKDLIGKLPPVREQRTQVHTKYADHFADLLEAGLVDKGHDLDVAFVSSYFSVDKTVDTSCSIFNGKALSKLCPVPEPVNLCDTRHLIDGMKKFIARQKAQGKTPSFFAFGADFRHWFHQISAPRWLRRLFGLQLRKGGRYQWKSLPMGWSWSPVLAQSAAWATLLFREPTQAPILDESAFRDGPDGQSRLPTWVDVIHNGEVHGMATVYYDNFLFLCDCNEAYQAVKERVAQNCGLLRTDPLFEGDRSQPDPSCRTGALIKEGSYIDVTPRLFCTEEGAFDYLGVRFQGEPERPVSGRQKPKLVAWTWKPAKEESWRVRAELCARCDSQEEMTLREAATLSGQCVFALLMGPFGLHGDGGRSEPHLSSSAPRSRPDDLLDAASQIGREVAAHQRVSSTATSWEELASCGSWRTGLAETWKACARLQTEPYRLSVEEIEESNAPITRDHIMCTDASLSALGWCGGRRGGDAWRPSFPHECGGRVVLTDLHIYILEVEAALEGLADWVQKHPTPADRVTLVVDNAAAAFTLRYGFSNNRVANRLMQTPANRANLRRVEDVVLVISQDNPSDCCSRNGPEDWPLSTSVGNASTDVCPHAPGAGTGRACLMKSGLRRRKRRCVTSPERRSHALVMETRSPKTLVMTRTSCKTPRTISALTAPVRPDSGRTPPISHPANAPMKNRLTLVGDLHTPLVSSLFWVRAANTVLGCIRQGCALVWGLRGLKSARERGSSS